jgi:hypothetical protein
MDREKVRGFLWHKVCLSGESAKDDFKGDLNCVAIEQQGSPETVTLRQGKLPFLW